MAGFFRFWDFFPPVGGVYNILRRLQGEGEIECFGPGGGFNLRFLRWGKIMSFFVPGFRSLEFFQFSLTVLDKFHVENSVKIVKI